MDQQTLINLAAGTSLAVFGWFARVMWEAVTALREDLHRIEVELPSSYVKKEEFAEALRAISDKLDRISDKLDEKVDKRGA